MASTKKIAFVSSLLFFLLLLLNLIRLASKKHPCPPFSCGKLNNISSPFRREGDPPGCGDDKYQLTCRGNEAVMRIGSADYYVASISDEQSTFHLVDPKLAAGNCSLPSQSVLSVKDYFSWRASSWAVFVNCSKAIYAGRYLPVSCLSHTNSTLLVYLIVGSPWYRYSLEMRSLHPACNFLSSIPIAHTLLSREPYDLDDLDVLDYLLENTSREEDVFRILQQGFDVYYWQGMSLFRIHMLCLRITKSNYWNRNRSDAIPIYSWYPTLLKSENYYFNCIHVPGAINIFLLCVQTLIAFLILWRITMLPVVVYFFLAYKLWSTRTIVDTVEKFLRNHKTLMPQRYAYTDLIAMTRYFRDRVGQGGFGSVFRGELAGGTLVAVKLLGNSRCNGEEFISEVSTIGRIHHANVVRLVGFCSEGSRRALVYEYMPRGSLDKYIFNHGDSFISERLVDIAIGVARGIDYLHRGCDMQILHFDIKPHNILLDHNFTPKISDFGLARLYPKDNSLVSMSAARGTIGYIAPELISRSFGTISQKSDVYSYGMLLLEMAGRRRNVNPHADNSSQVYYPSWVYDKLTQNGQVEEMEVESILEIEDLERKLAIVGLWCIQMRPADRPTMAKVIEMLEEGDAETLPIPPKPFLGSADPDAGRQQCWSSIATELSIISE